VQAAMTVMAVADTAFSVGRLTRRIFLMSDF
jgi:hypothetical protein